MEPLRPRDPKSIGPYQLVGRVGAGGMGVVYLASKGSQTVALKIIRDSLIDDTSQATRFLREIETLKSIDSPHVAKVLDTGTHKERPWFTTEFVNGPDLKSYVLDKGPVTGKGWDALAKGLLEGISAIHAADVIHRDIKPANIILSETGPKIIDFGIAQVVDATSVTSTGAIAGTPAWFSPEQIEGAEISKATDLFSAGSTLVYAATGKTPWGVVDSTTKASVYKILLDEPDLSGLTEQQSQLVRPLLSKNPRERLGKQEQEITWQRESQITSPRDLGTRLGGMARSTQVVFGVVALFIAAGIALAASFFAGPGTLTEEANSAEQPIVEQDLAESTAVRPLGSGFFEEIASEIEFSSDQVDDQITFTLSGPGASYLSAAEVSMSDLPEELSGECDSFVTLERVPVGTAYWVGGCGLSTPESGETVPVLADVILTFGDNDSKKYVFSNSVTITIETRPVRQVIAPQQRLTVTPIDRDNRTDSATLSGSAFGKRVFVQGDTLVYCTWGGWEALYRERIQKDEFTQALAISPAGTVAVGTGTIELGSVSPLYQAGQDCPGFSWSGEIPESNSSERLQVSWETMAPHAGADGSVFLRIIPPGGYGGSLEYIVSKK